MVTMAAQVAEAAAVETAVEVAGAARAEPGCRPDPSAETAAAPAAGEPYLSTFLHTPSFSREGGRRMACIPVQLHLMV